MTDPESTSNDEAPASKVTVLAIDDEQPFLEFLDAVISSEQVHFLSTTDPEEGLRMTQKWRPPVVMLDLNMAKLGGLAVLERILEINPNTDVAMLTADYTTESAVQAIQKGACDYLVKPISAERVRERIGGLVKEADAASIANGSKTTYLSRHSLKRWWDRVRPCKRCSSSFGGLLPIIEPH